MKKKACMADGGLIYPQERAPKPEPPKQPSFVDHVKNLVNLVTGKDDRPPVTQKPPTANTLSDTRNAILTRHDEINKAANYARGGVIPVSGIGSGTSDSIPVIVAGKKVRLSDGEGAAILPAKTMKNKAAVEAVEEIIEATNGKPPVKDDEETEGMACGGVKAKHMAAGGIIDPETQKPKMTDYVVPTVAPTAQQIYGFDQKPAAYRSSSGVIRSGNSFSDAPSVGQTPQAVAPTPVETSAPTTGVVRNGNSFSAAPATPWLPEGGMLRPENRARLADISNNGALRQGRSIFGPQDQQQPAPTIAAPTAPAAVTPTVTPQQAAFSNEGRPAELNTAISQDQSLMHASTGNAGDARLNAQNGVLSFTDKSFDPTQQQFAPGVGAISNPRTGKAMVLAGSDAAAAPGPTDAYGNSTALTQQYQDQLDKLRSEGSGTAAGPQVAMLSSLKGEQADRDRFTQFVNESNAARLAHDLGTGGGTARTEAGKIAALHDMQRSNEAVRTGQTARDLAATHGANQLAVVDAQGKNQLAVTGAQGANQLATAGLQGMNQLANTGLSGQNQLAVEQVKQTSPESQLKMALAQGQVEDNKAQRTARTGLLAAIDSGNKEDTDLATKKAIAAGVLKSEKPTREFTFYPSAMGGGYRIDTLTGATHHVDVNGKATPVNMGQQQGATQAPQAAIDFLKKNPSQADAFKQKYGYLPQ